MLNWTEEWIRVPPAWLHRFASLGIGGGQRLTFVVSASVRFSGALGDSRFKTIELCAEATLDGKETWSEAHGTAAGLAREIADELG